VFAILAGYWLSFPHQSAPKRHLIHVLGQHPAPVDFARQSPTHTPGHSGNGWTTLEKENDYGKR